MIKNRIAELRKMRGWSQRDLGRKLDVSTRAIMNWENYISDPSATNIIALASLFHVSTDYILGYCDKTYISVTNMSAQYQRLLNAINQAFINAVDES